MKFWKSEYKWILIAAIVIRMIAAVFSAGYGMHDDHFLIIESSSSWVDGHDYNGWLPWSDNNRGGPEGHSFTYVGLNYCYFYVMDAVGIDNPQLLMFFNRFLHALASFLVVLLGIRITEKLSSIKEAKLVGWVLALLWILPFMSVRNLVEVAPIPFLMIGVWQMIRNKRVVDFLYAGLIIGLAVSFRYQIGVFAIGLAAVYFFQWEWKRFIYFCLGVLITFGITQGIVDYFIWGYPFAEMIEYITYNMNEGTGYLPNTNYFMYFYVLVGALFVPLGIVVFVGFIRSWKKYALLFVPTAFFILFHTFYPNRQERFVITILPFFIMLGVMGYQLFKESNFKEKIWKISWVAFWVLNIPFLFFASTMYSKESRVEAMYALYDNGMEKERILLEGSASQRTSMLPKFYSKSWECSFVNRTNPDTPLKVDQPNDFDYIMFFDEKDLQPRIDEYRELYPSMELVKKCPPSSIDRLLRWLNPRNANEYIEVWKTNKN